MSDSGAQTPHDPDGREPQSPYGHPQGQQPYGASPYGAAVESDERPSTVTAAAVISIICAGLSALGFGIFAIVAVATTSGAGEFDDLIYALGVVSAVLALLSLVGVLLGALLLRRSNTIRILNVIWCSLIALFSLFDITSETIFFPGGPVISFLPLVASVTVIALLFIGGSKDWYARRQGGPASHGMPGGPTYG